MLSDFLTALSAAAPSVVHYLPWVAVALAGDAMLMPWLPVPADPHSVYGYIYAPLNALAQNYRNARNAAPAVTNSATDATKTEQGAGK